LGLSDIFVHDFDNSFNELLASRELHFHLASPGERLINIATFVVDLTRDESELFSRMSSDYRRKIRKAENLGVKIAVYDQPGPDLIYKFSSDYAQFAASRGIDSFNPDTLAKMYAEGNGLLLIIERDGDVTHYLHICTVRKTAIFMYGFGASRENDGAGQYLHWRAMMELKARGCDWYDLGGVPDMDRSNGIFCFKEGFGGVLVSLGTEWRRTGHILAPILVATRLGRSGIRRLTG